MTVLCKYIILALAYMVLSIYVLKRIMVNHFEQAQHENLCITDRFVIWKQCMKNYLKLSLNSAKPEGSLFIAVHRRKK